MRNNIDVSQLTHLRDGIYRAFEGEIYGYPVCILATKMQNLNLIWETTILRLCVGGVMHSHPLYQKKFTYNIMTQVDTDANVNGGLTFSNMAQTVGERQKISLKTIGVSASIAHTIGTGSILALLKMLKPIVNVWL